MSVNIEPANAGTFLTTLLSSWGGDTPPEAIWALGDFVNWINAERGLNLEAPTEQEYYYDGEEGQEEFDRKLDLIKEALGG